MFRYRQVSPDQREDSRGRMKYVPGWFFHGQRNDKGYIVKVARCRKIAQPDLNTTSIDETGHHALRYFFQGHGN